MEVAPLHAGAEHDAVAGAGHGGVAHFERVAVHEIGVVAVRETRKECALPLNVEGIPTHVRHRPIRVLREAGGAAGNDAEAARIALQRRLE